MKRFTLSYSFLILFLGMALCTQARGSIRTHDSLAVYTDRNLYVSGELIHFSAFPVQSEESGSMLISKILYAELISPAGMKLAGSKFLQEESIFEGSVQIPSNLITGLYYLKVYTKMMRNLGPASYAFVPVKIINPVRSEVQDDKLGSAGNFTPLPDGYESSGLLPLSIECSDSIVRPRDSILIRILPGKNLGKALGIACISVVPSETVPAFAPHAKPVLANPFSGGAYLAETRGLTLSGLVKQKGSGKPIPSDKIHLSIMGGVKDYLSVMSDSAGRFYFPLPALTGTRELFIYAEDKDGQLASIQIDNDFCTERIQLPSSPFNWQGEEQEISLGLAKNEQVRNIYYPSEQQDIDPVPADTLPFYGTPSTIVNLDKYIQLPSVEEYINEFLPEVRVRKQDGKKTFTIYGRHSELAVYPPLVLIDWISVPEVSKILAMPPDRIARIEIVNSPYIKGDMIYGGVISFISKRRDFAGIDLNSSGLFLRFNFLEKNHQPILNIPGQSNHLPDTRNTLAWLPDISLRAGKPFEIWVRTSDQTGRYEIICRGITSGGLELKGSCSFLVR